MKVTCSDQHAHAFFILCLKSLVGREGAQKAHLRQSCVFVCVCVRHPTSYVLLVWPSRLPVRM